MRPKGTNFFDQPVGDLDKALKIVESDPEHAWQKALRWDPGCDTEHSVLVWNRGLVGDCAFITWGELFAMLAELGRKARSSVDTLCSLSTDGCTKAVITRATIEESTCRDRQWDLTLRVYFKCVKP
ncbi:MAG: hypothetical protein OEZ08_13815 [Betaproteobacteria bacterium]|nr:hypothetical protein [Betaproteobacteria bacterium]